MRNIGKRRLKPRDNNEGVVEIDAILDSIHDDVLITDGKGRIIKISKSFETVYGVAKADVLGTTVYELEKKGVFKPSAVAQVLKSGKKKTLRQKNKRGRDLIVTATPVRNRKGEIIKVVSFTRDLTDIINLNKEYSKLESQMEKYTAEIEELRNQVTTIDGVVGNSQKMEEVIKLINKSSKFDANVLLLGESGVGKTMFSKIIHSKGHRGSGPFIEINCASIPENLLESELFGYEKGAFTGANAGGKIGLIELAHEGSLLLDEISELPMNLQAKILKVIQDKKITRVGGTKEIKVDFRLISASNRNLEEMVLQKKFRQDLYYRLNVIIINIPPLVERKDDIIPLVSHFLTKFNKKYGLKKTFSASAISKLLEYKWPGNVRELENTVERTVLTSESGRIKEDSLPENILKRKGENLDKKSIASLNEAIEDLEGSMIRNAYRVYGTTVGVAKALKISQPTAVRKIKKYT